MKQNGFLFLFLILLLLISACSSKTNQAKIQLGAEQNKAVAVEAPPSQKTEYHTQIAIIGMNDQALEAAISGFHNPLQT